MYEENLASQRLSPQQELTVQYFSYIDAYYFYGDERNDPENTLESEESKRSFLNDEFDLIHSNMLGEEAILESCKAKVKSYEDL